MTDHQHAILERFGDAPFFIFCDHASNVVPAEFHCLGLPDDILQTHIAWDIGSGALGTELGRRLKGVVFKCAFSRLIVDVNRSLTAKDLIAAVSDQIPVPGNQMLSDEARRRRIDDYHHPYHEQLDAALDDIAANGPFFAISVHSFTRRLMGAPEDRPWPIGMLWETDEESALTMIRYLSNETGWEIGDNEPYDAREFNYTVDRHLAPRGIRHLTFEIRQDILCNDDAIEDLAGMLADGVRETAAQCGVTVSAS